MVLRSAAVLLLALLPVVQCSSSMTKPWTKEKKKKEFTAAVGKPEEAQANIDTSLEEAHAQKDLVAEMAQAQKDFAPQAKKDLTAADAQAIKHSVAVKAQAKKAFTAAVDKAEEAQAKKDLVAVKAKKHWPSKAGATEVKKIEEVQANKAFKDKQKQILQQRLTKAKNDYKAERAKAKKDLAAAKAQAKKDYTAAVDKSSLAEAQARKAATFAANPTMAAANAVVHDQKQVHQPPRVFLQQVWTLERSDVHPQEARTQGQAMPTVGPADFLWLISAGIFVALSWWVYSKHQGMITEGKQTKIGMWSIICCMTCLCAGFGTPLGLCYPIDEDDTKATDAEEPDM